MKIQEVISILEQHNKWRRNNTEENIPMVNVKQLGVAIDEAVELLKNTYYPSYINNNGNKLPWTEELEQSVKAVIKRGIISAEEAAMNLNGYIVVAHRIDDEKWIVKKYKDGTIEKLSKI